MSFAFAQFLLSPFMGSFADLCWLLGTSVLKIGPLYPMEQAFLPKQVRCEYNQQGPCCSYSLPTRLFSRRRGSVRVLSAHLHEATHRFPLSHTSRTCAPLDQTPNDLSSPRHACRSCRGKSELIAENALLRHQLSILRRQIKGPTYRKVDRLLLVVLAGMVRTWKQALFLVQPETLLRWHRELFRLFWKRKSKARSRMQRLSSETISLIQQMEQTIGSGERAHSGRASQAGYSSK